MAFDVDLFAQPMDFTQFARSYPAIPLRGPHTGPLRAQGTLADLVLAATMRGRCRDDERRRPVRHGRAHLHRAHERPGRGPRRQSITRA